MKTLICPNCGCSLVQLGVTRDKAATYSYDGTEYHFCCQGCADLFVADPEQHLQRTKDLVVCPTCLAENHQRRHSRSSTPDRKSTIAGVRLAKKGFKKILVFTSNV